jgi:hypothetical protein
MLSLKVGSVLLHACNWNLLKAFRVYCKLYWYSQLCLIGGRQGVAGSKWILLMHYYDAVLTKQHGESITKCRRIQYEDADNTRHENAVLSYYNYNPPSRSRDNSVVTATRQRARRARLQFPADFLHSVQTISGAHPALYPIDPKVYILGCQAAGAWNWTLTSILRWG